MLWHTWCSWAFLKEYLATSRAARPSCRGSRGAPRPSRRLPGGEGHPGGWARARASGRSGSRFRCTESSRFSEQPCPGAEPGVGRGGAGHAWDTRFRVWGPRARRLARQDLAIAGRERVAMTGGRSDGFFEVVVPDAEDGTRYLYVLDGVASAARSRVAVSARGGARPVAGGGPRGSRGPTAAWRGIALEQS